ncbi:MAG: hypothetical protein AAF449_06915, partial [Myxococcota bacterium]
VFEEEAAGGSAANVLSEDAPLKKGRALEAASLLAEPGTEDSNAKSSSAGADEAAAGLASPSAPRVLEADEQPTAHLASKLALQTSPETLPPTADASTPWYFSMPAVAAVTAVATLVVLLIFSQQSGRFESDRTTPTIAPVTIRLPGDKPDTPSKEQPLAAASASTADAPVLPATPPKPVRRSTSNGPAQEDDSSSASKGKKESDSSGKRTRRTKRRRSRSKKVVTGFLNVGARPWAEITIDGKRWPYQTPQAGIELPVGKHVVVLHNPKTGVTKRTAVYIKHGKYRTVNLDLRR